MLGTFATPAVTPTSEPEPSATSTPPVRNGPPEEGPWIFQEGGLQLIVEQIRAAEDIEPTRLALEVRMENGTVEDYDVSSNRFFFVDDLGTSYEADPETGSWPGAYSGIRLEPQDALRGVVVLDRPLEGAPTTLEVRMRAEESYNTYSLLEMVVPIPSL